ncbi:MAG: C25 family cysteine peptidase [Planctomycetota bacterium]
MTGYGTKRIEYTDNYYGNTSGDKKKPEIAVGRMIGNSAAQLRDAVQRTIDIINGVQNFDQSSGLVVSGRNSGPGGGSTWINFTLERWGMEDRLDSRGYADVDGSEDPSEAGFITNARNRDAIHLAAHGSEWSWDVVGRNTVHDTYDPGMAAPLIYVSSCLTGRYPVGYCFAEAFLNRGASAYIGATEVSYSPYSQYLAEGFWDRFDVGYPAGRALKQAKRNRMGDGAYGKYNSCIFHLFGDPKLEPVLPGSRAVVQMGDDPDKALPIPLGQGQLHVDIPNYEVVSGGTYDHVSITAGTHLAKPSCPEVPAYGRLLALPPGLQVQNVILVKKEKMSSTTGLNLPWVMPAENNDAGPGVEPLPSQQPQWWPDRDFDWQVTTMPGDDTVLEVTIYPFQYNAATTDAQFYQSYDFEVLTSQSAISIRFMGTDRQVYKPGETVNTDLYIVNETPQIQNVVVETVIKTGDGAMVAGLPLHWLEKVKGVNSCTESWNSTGIPPGDYQAEVTLRDEGHALLDRQTCSFVLGASDAEVTSVKVSPACFGANEQVSIGATLQNTGDVSISGIMVVDVRSPKGILLAEFEQEFNDLTPNGVFNLTQAWTTPPFSGRQCEFLAYARYGGKTTAVAMYPPLSEFADGDFNDDDAVDLRDFVELSRDWMLTGLLSTDIAPRGGDCRVDILDLAQMCDNWLADSQP